MFSFHPKLGYNFFCSTICTTSTKQFLDFWSSTLFLSRYKVPTVKLWRKKKFSCFGFNPVFSQNCPSWCKKDLIFLVSKSLHNLNKTFSGALVFDVVFLSSKCTNCENLKKNKFLLKKNFIQTGFHPEKFFRMFFFCSAKLWQSQENISEDSSLRRCFSYVTNYQLWNFEEKKNFHVLDGIQTFFGLDYILFWMDSFFFGSKLHHLDGFKVLLDVNYIHLDGFIFFLDWKLNPEDGLNFFLDVNSIHLDGLNNILD